jgi:hypothetical protein
MRLIDCFCDGDLNLDRLNYGMITLIPKEPEAKTLKKFRPISLKIVALRFLENC